MNPIACKGKLLEKEKKRRIKKGERKVTKKKKNEKKQATWEKKKEKEPTFIPCVKKLQIIRKILDMILDPFAFTLKSLTATKKKYPTDVLEILA